VSKSDYNLAAADIIIDLRTMETGILISKIIIIEECTINGIYYPAIKAWDIAWATIDLSINVSRVIPYPEKGINNMIEEGLFLLLSSN